MSSVNLSISLLSVIFGFSIFATLDCMMRSWEWEVLDNKERVMFWGDIRDIGFKISMITLLSSLALNSFCDFHFQLFHLH